MNRDQLALVARLHHAEHRSGSDTLQLAAAQEAVAQAHESIVQLEFTLRSERRALHDAETSASTEREARAKALHLLAGAQRSEAEQRLFAEQAREEMLRVRSDAAKAAEEQKRAYGVLEKKRRVQLKELEEALVHAEYRTYRHAQRHAEITAELQKERRLRQATEKQLEAERRAREDAVHALLRTVEHRGFWNKLLHG